MRTWSHAGEDRETEAETGWPHCEEPVPEPSLGTSRSPTPLALSGAAGFAVDLLQSGGAGDRVVWTRAHAREVYPWWRGQTHLERWLWIVLAVGLLLVVLLLLGARWRQLDVVTWCILISGLLHLLILWLVAGVEIVLEDPPGDGGDAGRLEVQFVSAYGGGGDGGGDRASDFAAQLAFAGRAFEPELELASVEAGPLERAVRVQPRLRSERASEAGAALDEVAARLAAAAQRDGVTPRDAVAAPAPSAAADAGLDAAERDAARGPTAAPAPAEIPAGGRARSTAPPRLQALPATVLVDAAAPLPAPASSGTRTRAVPLRKVAQQDAAPQAAAPRVAVRDEPSSDPRAAASRAADDTLAAAGRRVATRRPAAAPASSAAARPRRRASLDGVRATALAAPGLTTSLVRPTGRLPAKARTRARSTRPPAGSAAPAPMRAATVSDDPRPRVAAAADAPLARAAKRDRSAAARPDAAPLGLPPRPRRASAPARSSTEDRHVGSMPVPSSFLAPARSRARVARSADRADEPRLDDLYRNRTGPEKQAALDRFGGSVETERAVAAGLRYLASSQRRGGYWGSKRRRDRKYGQTHVGKTALCVLAFLGAGHTHRSGSEYSANVAAALEFLIDEQRAAGHFGDSSSYGHGIATYALAECYAMTRDPNLRAPLERGVARILERQQRGGGWGYFSETRRPEDRHARTSVSSWMVMALESARIGGLDVPDDALADAEAFMRRMFDRRRGYVLYSRDASRLNERYRTLPASTPAATFCLLLLGAEPDDAAIQDVLDFTLERRPRRYRRGSTDDFVFDAVGNVYFWYYGSLACMLTGGETWELWNAALKDVLVPAQNPDGSFTPVGFYARYAGTTSRTAATPRR